jgi:hypothetical protein
MEIIKVLVNPGRSVQRNGKIITPGNVFTALESEVTPLIECGFLTEVKSDEVKVSVVQEDEIDNVSEREKIRMELKKLGVKFFPGAPTEKLAELLVAAKANS